MSSRAVLDRDAAGAVLAVTGGVLAGPTAALLHGLDLLSVPAQHHVVVPRDSHRRAPHGCRLHRVDLAPGDLCDVDGLAATTVLRSVLDCARWLPAHEAVAVGDSALRRRGVTRSALLRAVAALPRSRSTAPVRRVADLVDGRSESVLESVARVVLEQAGVQEPVLQMRVYDERGGFVARVDLAWPEARLVVELDGFAFHSTRRDVRRDRARANRLTLGGWRVLRFGWEEVVGRPEAVVAAVRAALSA